MFRRMPLNLLPRRPRRYWLNTLLLLVIAVPGLSKTGWPQVPANQVPANKMPPAIKVPPGFQVDHFADDDLAHDIHSLTFDAQGRVVVSGPGYVRILIDTDGDGLADDFRTFADGPATGAQGLYFMGPHLLASGDEGLQIFRDDDRDDRADGPPQTVLKIKAGGEHHVHSIQRGPDGWWYLIAGNNAGVTQTYAALPTSPISRPEAGVLMRLKPDLSEGEIVADGFRNAYDFAFNPQGDIFTFDSDGERDVSLPWYRPCRVFHVTPRSNSGWVSRSWKRPDDFPDMPRAIAAFGRGSPTGVVCYRHTHFPSHYDGAVFVLDWTFGRVLAMSMEQEHGFWKASPEVFATGNGHFGFAPTDLEVSPDGSLFVSVGGRGSRGGVYRISWTGAEAVSTPAADNKAADETAAADRLDAILDAPQPLSGWSRARWYPEARELGATAFAAVATDERRKSDQRIRAIEILTDVFGGPDAATLHILTHARSIPVRARAAWAVGRSRPASPGAVVLSSFLSDSEPLVTRFALEALTTVTDARVLDQCLPRLAAALGSEDAAVRFAASVVIVRLSPEQRRQLQQLLADNRRAQVTMALGATERSDQFSPSSARLAARIIADDGADNDLRFAALRLLQLALGDVGPSEGRPGMLESYLARADLSGHSAELQELRRLLEDAFPCADERCNRELIRCISMLGSSSRDLIAGLLARITETSHPADDVHCLAALTQIDAIRTLQQSAATASGLVSLEIKIRDQQLKQDSNWDDRIRELYETLCQRDSMIPKVIVEQPGFGMPGHVLFLHLIPADRTQRAIDGFARNIRQNPEYQWNDDVVSVLGRSHTDKHHQLLREQLDNPSVRDAVLVVLSRSPRPEDRRRFVEGLDSPQFSVVKACVQALKQLPRSNDASELHLLLRTARRMDQKPQEFALREDLIRLLQNNTGQSFGFAFGSDGHRPQPEAFSRWQQHLQKRFPDFKPLVDQGGSAQHVMERLSEISWAAGRPARGEQLFARLSCSRCHGGRKALGPDLQGVTRRFSRNDLWAAIVDPNRDVSERYQMTTIATTDGKVYSGLIVYESVDGLLLRDAEHRTYRIEAGDIETKVKRRQSLMPAGLLKSVVDQDLADLDAYLRQL
ncbi:MAG: hypothetical protein RIK87_08255 [Fuerstiella sp.]